MSAIRAIVWDIGGPIDTELIHEREVEAVLAASLRQEGFAVDAARLRAASDHAVAVFAPNTYAAMAWELTGRDPGATRRVIAALEASAASRMAARGGIELRPGIAPLLHALANRGLLLGLAANQPAAAVASLDRHGLGALFAHRQVSGHHGFRKPDIRVFLHASEALGVPAAGCLAIGDRIDNDIAPARILGMRTVLFRTGRHADQQPRSPDDLADAEVRSVEELERALERLLGQP